MGTTPLRLLALTLALALSALLSGCGSSHVQPPSRNVGTRIDGPIPKSIRDIPLVDSHGRTRHISDLKGKLVAISPAMTLCQESCPLDTAAVVDTARAVRRAGLAHKVVFLSITVDPRRDVPAQLAAYRKLYAGPANWLTLTGTPANIHRLWKYLGVFVKKVPQDTTVRNWRTGKKLTYDVQHSDELFFLDGRGHERFVLEGMPSVHKSQIPGRLYGFLSSEGRKNIAHPKPTDWTEGQALHVLGWLLDRRIPA
ncbi:MAG: SCO family protein [Marmoricola sp.]